MSASIYRDSTAAQKLAQSGLALVADWDNTLNVAGKKVKKGETSPALDKENLFRGKLFELVAEWMNMVVTMCTPGMFMTLHRYHASVAAGYNEPQPKMGMDEHGRRFHCSLKSLPEFDYADNWHAVGSVGSRIAVARGNAYHVDLEFAESLSAVGPTWSDTPWNREALDLLQALGLADARAIVDLPGSYEQGLIDVAKLPGRYELVFKDRAAKLDALARFDAYMRSALGGQFPLMRESFLLDESNPAHNREMMFLLPRQGDKCGIINRTFSQLAAVTGVSLARTNIVFAGDAPPDLAMLKAVPEARAAMVIVGGSRLYPWILDRASTHFAGVPMGDVPQRLESAERAGFYRYGDRLVVVGDQAYPGTLGPETLVRFLEENPSW